MGNSFSTNLHELIDTFQSRAPDNVDCLIYINVEKHDQVIYFYFLSLFVKSKIDFLQVRNLEQLLTHELTIDDWEFEPQHCSNCCSCCKNK